MPLLKHVGCPGGFDWLYISSLWSSSTHSHCSPVLNEPAAHVSGIYLLTKKLCDSGSQIVILRAEGGFSQQQIMPRSTVSEVAVWGTIHTCRNRFSCIQRMTRHTKMTISSDDRYLMFSYLRDRKATLSLTENFPVTIFSAVKRLLSVRPVGPVGL